MKRKTVIILLIIALAGAGGGSGAYFCQAHANQSSYSARRKHRQPPLPQLTDQQVSILVGHAVEPAWLDQQLAQGSLIYGVVKPGDTVPAGVQNYSFLVTADEQTDHYLFFKQGKRQVVTVKYVDGDTNKLQAKRIRLRYLVHRFYRTKEQRRQVNDAVAKLRTE